MVGGLTITSLNSLWGWLTATQAAVSAPTDAQRIWAFFVNAPDALPWAFAAIGILLLAWSLWPPTDELSQGDGATTGGPIFPIIGDVGGDAIFGSQFRQATNAPGSHAIGSVSGDFVINQERAPDSPRSPPRRRPETPIWQAVEHVRALIGDDDLQHCYPEARRRIRQAALEGHIEIWGKKEIPPQHFQSPEVCREVWTAVPQDYWEDFELNSMAVGELFEDREHTWPNPYVPQLARQRYWSLVVSNDEIESEWRKPRSPRPINYPPDPQDWMR